MSWKETCIDEAAAIADRFSERAISTKQQASWMHRNVLYNGDTEAIDQLPRLSPLNPSVYSGTAGMAVLYARLWRFTDDRRHRDMATKAITNATRNAIYVNESKHGQIGSDYRFGHFLGTTGIAWAAHEVSRLTGHEEAARQAERLVSWVDSTIEIPGMVDLMNGLSGGALSLLAMGDDVPGARDLAKKMGDKLLAKTDIDAESGGMSWGDRQAKGGKNLTGFSHGTAGIALALGHLWKATGEDRYEEAVQGALRYERHYFSPKRKNWPNFSYGKDERGEYTYSSVWCHGAPGIGFGRALLHGVDQRWDVLDEVRAAADTTKAVLNGSLGDPGLDYQICHGVVGNLECLWAMNDVLEPGSGKSQADRVMRLAVAQHGSRQYDAHGPAVEWPSALSLGPHPALITGTAGVAHMFLRLADPIRVPTVAAPAGLMVI